VEFGNFSPKKRPQRFDPTTSDPNFLRSNPTIVSHNASAEIKTNSTENNLQRYFYLLIKNTVARRSGVVVNAVAV
jgi:hypothetical protein